MRSSGIRIEDLPLAYQAQVRAQLGGQKAAAVSKQDSGSGMVRIPKRKEPDKTEADYNRSILHGEGIYEACTLRLPGGSKYTPDWMTFEDGRPVFHECKGSYRLGSAGRAATAFRECVAAFPQFAWVWASCSKNGSWKVSRFPRKTDQSAVRQ